jgi:hypothetical protein
MKSGIQNIVKTVLAGGLLLVGLTACESPTEVAETDDAALELASSLAQELDLSSTQAQALDASLDGEGERMREPGALWYLAARLQEELTDEQKVALFERAEAMTDVCAVRGAGPLGRGHGMTGGHLPHDARFMDGLVHHAFRIIDDLLTDEQRAAIEDLMARYRSAVQDLMAALRNREITEEEFRTEMEALREALRVELAAQLTEEQRTELEARLEAKRAEVEARRDAVKEQSRAAMFEVLGLAGDAADAVSAILDETAVEREALLEQVRSGAIDPREQVAALQELHERERAELQLLMDPTQWEIVEIHDALAVRMGCGMRPGQPHRPGGPGGSGYTGPTGGAFGFN